MAKYKAYPEYKDSGVEWLGEVPREWDVINIKYLSQVKRGASPRPIDDPKFFDDDGDYAWVRIADVTASDTYLLETTQKMSALGSSLSVKLEPNKLFLSIAGTVGKPCITAIKSCIHDGFVYFPYLKIPNKFLFYVFSGEQAYKGLGKMGTQLNLNTDTVGGIKVALPSNNYFIANIINFLDYETAKIDNLIEKQQQLIELLKEKRQAVISHAVTKGLDPDVQMKNSGVEWLGDVPEHWCVSRIKNYAKIESGHTPSRTKPEYWISCNIPWVSLNDSKQLKEVDYIEDTYYKISELGMANSSAHLLPARAVVFTRDASIGLSAITTKSMAVSQHLIAWVCDEKFIIPEFLLLVFYAMEKEFERYTFGATIKTIGMDNVRGLKSTFPPIEEQRNLIDWAFSKIEKIKSSINKVEDMLSLLQERRTALISAAVTGKIDVRDWVAPETQDVEEPQEATA
ncbi:restriction endonuclease subunit S [Pantoea agglomerans]|jgi:type I restriction enzyme S subunit|uniref:restriction endonuclease subunit S n=1 Tax=Enterobacter agglomerans TaxID=549 RepID=UPI003C7D2687